MSELPAPSKISVEPEDDFQLWVVRGKLPDGSEYCLPIRARPHHNGAVRYFQVPGSGTYTNQQWLELTAIFDAFDSCPQQNDYWFCESNFLKFASAVRGLNPEFYQKWPGFVARAAPPEEDSPETIDIETDPEFSYGETEFLKRVHYRVGSETLSWEAFRIIWKAVRKEAVRHLAESTKPLDLGFARIIPMPFRINWREALCVRFCRLFAVFAASPSERHEKLTEIGFYTALASPKLLAVTSRSPSKPHVRWTLELLPSPELQRAMEEYEFARADRLGLARYAKYVLNQMSKRLKLSLEILKFYNEQVKLAPGTVKNGNVFGTEILVPEKRTGTIRPGYGICEKLPLAADDAFKEFRDEEPGQAGKPRLYHFPPRQLTSPDRNQQEDSPSPSNYARRLPAVEPSNHSQFEKTEQGQSLEAQPGDIDVESG